MERCSFLLLYKPFLCAILILHFKQENLHPAFHHFFNQTKHNTEQKQSVRKKIEAWLLFIGSDKPADIMRVIEKKMRENEELNQKYQEAERKISEHWCQLQKCLKSFGFPSIFILQNKETKP